MLITLRNTNGETTQDIDVLDSLFNVPMNQALVHQVAVSHMANNRQGNASTKTRGKVAGGGAKPWRQKHTGRARQGSRRAPQWKGGGTVFGPSPRDYSQSIPKKMNRGAIRCLLSQKAKETKLIVLDQLNFENAATKLMAGVLNNLDINSSTLIVTEETDRNIVLSARNIPRVRTIPAQQINVIDLLTHDKLVMTLDAVRKAEGLWALSENVSEEAV
ncbi:MAG: 50S ribosomal protein L4 [Chloroflexi bacterium]|nr:50S ribosomal protein L4 [Chloroflexota bacterium]MQF99617.1 50S ribosomal protein L4 [SAR202 cluster bacterium]